MAASSLGSLYPNIPHPTAGVKTGTQCYGTFHRTRNESCFYNTWACFFQDVELAWTCCDYADTLREPDGAGDRAKAMSLLDESLAISSELGMRPLMERVLSRREMLGA